nr:hypothetical protein [Tanacetum cinerariifolium]
MVIKKLKKGIKSLSGNIKEDKIKQELEEIEIINIELDHKEKVLVITALKDNSRKLKGKVVVDEVVILHPIDPELLKINVVPLAPKLRNNRTTHYDYLKHTQGEITTLREIVKHERSLNPLNNSLDYAFSNKPMMSSTRVNLPTSASGSQPSGNTKKDKIQQTPSSAKKNKLEAYPRNVRSSLQNMKSVVNTKDIASVQNLKLNVVQIVLWYLDSGCSKHMTGDCSQLTNFVNKFLGTVKFGNDHVVKIMGYGGYQIGNVTISRVYFVEGLGHNLFFVEQFCNSYLKVAFRQHTCFIRNLKGLPKLKFKKDYLCYACAMGKSKKKSYKCKSEDTNQEKLYLLHMDLYGPMRVKSVNGKKYILVIVNDYSRFTWVKCLRSKDKAPNFIIKFLKMIQVQLKVGISYETSVARSPQQNGVVERRNRTLIEAARTIRIIKTIHVNFDELTAMASEQSSSGPILHEMTPATISSELVPKPTSSTPFDPPSPEVIALIAKVVAPEPTKLTGSPSSTTVDQDAPSPSKSSKSQTTLETQPAIIPINVEEDNHDIEVAHMGNDLFFGMLIPEVASDQSTSTDSIHIIVHLDHQIYKHNSKWTKDHPLENIIG